MNISVKQQKNIWVTNKLRLGHFLLVIMKTIHNNKFIINRINYNFNFYYSYQIYSNLKVLIKLYYQFLTLTLESSTLIYHCVSKCHRISQFYENFIKILFSRKYFIQSICDMSYFILLNYHLELVNGDKLLE